MKPLILNLVLLTLMLPPAWAMDNSSFQRLLQSLETAWASEQLSIIQLATANHTFTSEQISQLLQGLSFSSDQLAALELLAGRIEDPQRSFIILDAFTFSSDIEQAKVILANSRPLSTSINIRPLYVARQGLVTVPVYDPPSFQQLLERLREASFPSTQLQVLHEVAQDITGLTGNQVAQILELLSFPATQLTAIEILTVRVVNLSEAEATTILRVFSFETHRLEALEHIKYSLFSIQDIVSVTEVFDFPAYRQQAHNILASIRP